MKLTQEDSIDIGLAILYVILGLYMYLFPEIHNENELRKITGTLIQEPHFGETGGDVPHYFVRINLLNEQHYFVMKSCCYDKLDKDKVKMLFIGDTVDIFVRKVRTFGEKINRDYESFS